MGGKGKGGGKVKYTPKMENPYEPSPHIHTSPSVQDDDADSTGDDNTALTLAVEKINMFTQKLPELLEKTVEKTMETAMLDVIVRLRHIEGGLKKQVKASEQQARATEKVMLKFDKHRGSRHFGKP